VPAQRDNDRQWRALVIEVAYEAQAIPPDSVPRDRHEIRRHGRQLDRVSKRAGEPNLRSAALEAASECFGGLPIGSMNQDCQRLSAPLRSLRPPLRHTHFLPGVEPARLRCNGL
jgi:hypothetical protein